MTTHDLQAECYSEPYREPEPQNETVTTHDSQTASLTEPYREPEPQPETPGAIERLREEIRVLTAEVELNLDPDTVGEANAKVEDWQQTQFVKFLKTSLATAKTILSGTK